MFEILIKPILPRIKLFTTKQAYNRAILKALGVVSDEAIELLGKTVRTWKKPAEFRIKGNQYKRTVYTDNKIWLMLDKGTRAHMILPRHAKRLAFQTGFTPKTKVRTMASYKGSRSGATVFARGVHHPGTAAREWLGIAQGRMNSRLNGEIRVQLATLPGLAMLRKGVRST